MNVCRCTCLNNWRQAEITSGPEKDFSDSMTQCPKNCFQIVKYSTVQFKQNTRILHSIYSQLKKIGDIYHVSKKWVPYMISKLIK